MIKHNDVYCEVLYLTKLNFSCFLTALIYCLICVLKLSTNDNKMAKSVCFKTVIVDYITAD